MKKCSLMAMAACAATGSLALTPPGLPAIVPNPAAFITEDCIRP